MIMKVAKSYCLSESGKCTDDDSVAVEAERTKGSETVM